MKDAPIPKKEPDVPITQETPRVLGGLAGNTYILYMYIYVYMYLLYVTLYLVNTVYILLNVVIQQIIKNI